MQQGKANSRHTVIWCGPKPTTLHMKIQENHSQVDLPAKNLMIWLSPSEKLSWFVHLWTRICRNDYFTWKRWRNMPVLAHISLWKLNFWEYSERDGDDFIIKFIPWRKSCSGNRKLTCLSMKICFISWMWSADCSPSWHWLMFWLNELIPSILLFAQFESLPPTFDPRFLTLESFCAPNFPRMLGSGDSIHSRNFLRPSSSGNAFTTSIALTMPIPLQEKNIP